jgi:transposase
VLAEQVATKCTGKLRSFLERLPRPWQGAVEAVGFYHWFWDLAEPLGERMVLANATEVRLRAGSRPKTDYRDATWLATLLYEGRFDQDHHLRCFVPDRQLRALRELTRFRNNLSRDASRTQGRLRRILMKNNLPGPKDLDSPSALRWLKAYQTKLPVHQQEMCRKWTDSLIVLERQLADTQGEIERRIAGHPLWAKQAELLLSIKGIGPITVATLIAEIGDWDRFDHVSELVDYVGLSPRIFQSGATTRMGRLTKTGPRDARWVLTQAAWSAIRWEDRARVIFTRRMWKGGKHAKQIAAAAVARHLLVWAYYVLRSGEPFRGKGRPEVVQKG